MKFLKYLAAMAATVTMIASLCACGASDTQNGGQNNKQKITIGTSNFTEVIILGNVYTELIEENTDYEVEQKFGLAGAAVCFDALENEEIDMFVEYTGTALLNLLGQPMNTDGDEVWSTVHDLMLKEHGIHTSNPLGFNNTYVMSVKPKTAEKYNLHTLSDLIKASSDLRLGCTVEFIQRQDCLPLLESAHSAEFKDVSGLDASLRYDAIEADEVDVIDAFATDALLAKQGLVPLTDDLKFFPPYHAVNFVNQDLLESDPELKELLAKLDGTIDDLSMAAMNAKVDIDGMDAKQVAHEFLVEQGLVRE